MNTLINSYEEVVRRNIDFVCRLQTAVAVIAAACFALLGSHLSSYLGQAAIVLTIISIPSVAWLAKRRIVRYEKSGWKDAHPDLDFSGQWRSEVRFLHALKAVVDNEPPPPPQHGEILIEQTPFGIAFTSGKLKSTRTGNDLGGWTWLTANISDKGRVIYALYQMDDMPDPGVNNQRSPGYGFDILAVTEWSECADPEIRGRPKVMRNVFYDCVRDDGRTVYIGDAVLRRV
jgi:hypothetical protein